ncbi:ABC transporter ATP-binding protein [Actinomadura decatromicini]|uniref:ABC transporter ATP-binding protein n=1 Tax=Actinomadura decatromicini TaxID=2604572 RepID=A0A5D3F4J2_9ACTN|nr:ABC transporter ATP-binding protein [Actinomadura decatromicini]TYK43102.1 ABC transporter ATP-binding protein [Actinomadura decatromicini]
MNRGGKTEHALEGRGLAVEYDGSRAIDGLDIAIRAGAVTTLVGPNGSGKSTALNTLARILKPADGSVHLNGRDIAHQPTREIALQMALLPQTVAIPASVTVREIVGYGRYPHQGLLGSASREDRQAVEWALGATGLTRLAERAVDSLSGGERQRAWIAMALAQRTSVLLLDEPTTFLDIRYQFETLSLVRELNRRHGLTVCMVLHDLNQAAEFSDHLIMLRRGSVVAQGAPRLVMTPENVKAAFELDAHILKHPVSTAPLCIPIIPTAAVLEEAPSK